MQPVARSYQVLPLSDCGLEDVRYSLQASCHWLYTGGEY